MVKKLIVFILAAVLVSCSQQETLEIKHKESVKREFKKKDYSEPLKEEGYGDFYYMRSLDTIKGSDEYVIVAVYRTYNSISAVVIGKPTRLK